MKKRRLTIEDEFFDKDLVDRIIQEFISSIKEDETDIYIHLKRSSKISTNPIPNDYWVVDFSECTEFNDVNNGYILINRILDECIELDEKYYEKRMKKEINGYFKTYFKKYNYKDEELEEIRIDIGDGYSKNKKAYDYLFNEINS